MGILQAHTLFPLLTERNAPANTAQNTQPHCAENAYATRQNAPALCAKVHNKKPAFRRFLIAALTRTAKRPPALLTERNAPANAAHREPPHRAKIPRRAHQNAPAPTTNKKPAFRRVLIVSNGGPDKDRTCDLLHAMQALSQLSYRPFIKLISKCFFQTT